MSDTYRNRDAIQKILEELRELLQKLLSASIAYNRAIRDASAWEFTPSIDLKSLDVCFSDRIKAFALARQLKTKVSLKRLELFGAILESAGWSKDRTDHPDFDLDSIMVDQPFYYHTILYKNGIFCSKDVTDAGPDRWSTLKRVVPPDLYDILCTIKSQSPCGSS